MEIKFRGKIRGKQEWIYGFPGNIMGSPRIDQIIEIGGYYENGFGAYGHAEYIEPESVGQYSGYNDINDKDIYKGDILIIYIDDCRQEIPYVVNDIRELYFDCNNPDRYYRITSMEVIGNTTDNPELVI